MLFTLGHMQFTAQALERRKRIRLAVAAYAYEFTGEITLTDAQYEVLSYSIDKNQETHSDQHDKRAVRLSKKLDKFFRDHFEPFTGQWIRTHPDLAGIAGVYQRVYSKP